MTLDVATPLALALDSDAAILTTMTAVELSPEVSRSGTCRWCAWQGSRMLSCTMRRHVDGGDDELVDVVAPLLRRGRRSVRRWRVIEQLMSYHQCGLSGRRKGQCHRRASRTLALWGGSTCRCCGVATRTSRLARPSV
jgi:hypothetical protein